MRLKPLPQSKALCEGHLPLVVSTEKCGMKCNKINMYIDFCII